MDGERFDRFAKVVARGVSRRRLLIGLGAALAGVGVRRGDAQPCLPRPVGAESRSSYTVSGLTQEWCERDGGVFRRDYSSCNDPSVLPRCGEFEYAWASTCYKCTTIYRESGCAPCLL